MPFRHTRASKRVQHDYYAVDSEWMPEDASPSTVPLMHTNHTIALS